MTRSLRKGPFVDERLYQRVMHAKETGNHAPLRTWSRRCTIVPEFVGVNFEIHNGKTFHKLFVTEEMVGHKLGEFSPTRSFRGHSGRAKKAVGAAPAAPPPPAK
jgi:small subunit ribosomal protein S19